MTEATTIDHDAETGEVHEQQQPLKRKDLVGPTAIDTLRERGGVSGRDIAMGTQVGGARFGNMMEVLEFAKIMSTGDLAIPPHLRGNPGACLRIVLQADAWGMEPFAVAEKSYSVNGRIAYESQLVHALVERRAPLQNRLRPSWEGDIADGTRRAVVTGWLIGEPDPFVWKGPMIKDIKVKNSPEWAANPDKQLWYHASRDWARIYVPDVLLGVYTREEMAVINNRADDTQTVLDRLPAATEGSRFDAQGIAKTLRPEPEEEAVAEPAGEPKASEATETPAAQENAPAKPRTRKKQGPKEPETTVEPAAAQQEDAAAAKEPGTGDEYVTYARNWIAAQTDPENALARWEGERDMRAKCKLSVTARKALEREVLQPHVAKLKGEEPEADE